MAKVTIKDSEAVLRLANDNVLMRCLDCLHFRGTRHSSKDKPCNDLGVKSLAVAPECFTPNISVFRKHSSQLISVLQLAIRSFNSSDTRVLIALLARSGKLSKTPHDFLSQRWFFSNDGSYLSDYTFGYVMGISSDKQSFLLVGDNALKGRSGVVAHIMPDSLILPKIFKRIKTRLKEEGRIFRPDFIPVGKVNKVDYEPPSIDSAVDLLEATASTVKKKKSYRMVVVTNIREDENNDE